LFIWNCITLANPVYWFVFGDTNLRQSTGFQGMLGVAAMLPLIIALIAVMKPGKKLSRHNHQELHTAKLLLWVALVGYLLSIVGAALTAEGQPHSLRSCSAWIFALIAIGVGWHMLVSQARFKRAAILAGVILIAGTVVYAIDLAAYYPSRAASSFDSRQRSAIRDHKPIRYPRMSLDYYKDSDSNLWKK
jgi:cytochrome bd-type quinol oxidase subunit 2